MSRNAPDLWTEGMVPVRPLSLPEEKAMHRFFDTSPLSPSGRFVAYTVFPYDDRLPTPGDMAEVVVREVETGDKIYRTTTAAWDTQLGAQVQWGADDHTLYFNRLDSENVSAHGVVVDPATQSERKLQGQIYMVSPDGRFNVACRLESLVHVQAGYGVNVPPRYAPPNASISEEDGVYLTDLETGEERLLLSYAAICDQLPEITADLDTSNGAFYGFHAKFSPDSRRIMLLLRWMPSGGKKSKNFLLSFTSEGEDLRLSVHARDWGNGHHPNWCPDSARVIMNVSVKNTDVRFPFLDRALSKFLRKLGVRYYTRAYDLRIGTFDLDGRDLRIIAPQSYGSGHPTLHASGDFALTDAYPSERVARGDGTAPIRMFDLKSGQETTLFHAPVTPGFTGPAQEWRVDPHPAWDRSGRYLVFNAAPDGNRGVFLADFGQLLKDAGYA